MENNQQRRPYKLGLALSGGGARGFAHLGVYKAMQELGIKPNIISGTSAGAIAGLIFASGHSAEEGLKFFQDRKLLDFARPLVSKTGIMTMTGMEKRLSEFIHVETFEELQIPLVVTATTMNLGIPTHFSTESSPLRAGLLFHTNRVRTHHHQSPPVLGRRGIYEPTRAPDQGVMRDSYRRTYRPAGAL